MKIFYLGQIYSSFLHEGGYIMYFYGYRSSMLILYIQGKAIKHDQIIAIFKYPIFTMFKKTQVLPCPFSLHFTMYNMYICRDTCFLQIHNIIIIIFQ